MWHSLIGLGELARPHQSQPPTYCKGTYPVGNQTPNLEDYLQNLTLALTNGATPECVPPTLIALPFLTPQWMVGLISSPKISRGVLIIKKGRDRQNELAKSMNFGTQTLISFVKGEKKIRG